MDSIFPDEIFVQILRYVPVLDLFRGFYNLNSRLNRIIREVRIHIRSSLNKEEQQYIVPNINPEQIRSLYVPEEEYEFSNLTNCINIRQLEFGCKPGPERITHVHRQLEEVRPTTFPHLRTLTIYHQYWTSTFRKLCTMIFGNQFPVLKYVCLPYANGSCVPGIKTWSTSLISVRIECCNTSILYPLLDNLPNLEAFNCQLGTDDKKALTSQRLSLKYLYMTTYYPVYSSYRSMMGFEEMNNLYRCLPNLVKTILFIYHGGSIEDALHNLHRVLFNCQELRDFDCQIKFSGRDLPPESLNEFKNRHPLFTNCDIGTWKESTGYGCRIRTRNY